MFRKFQGFKRKESGASSHTVPEGSAASTASLPQIAQAQSSTDSRHSLKRSEKDESGPLGLTVVYAPKTERKVDIVFIHGLGGTSRWTWSKHKDPDLFWPLKFLPLEPDICLARILTFGYNAAFRKAGNVGTSVLDFAKDLLFDLKYAKDEQTEDLNMGHVPLIFVAHSMGGLIVKEAYLQGQNDPEYEGIIRAITAITFLSTPHRGTNLAQILNRILQSTMVSNSKQYIADLSRNSMTLQKLNEQFRHVAPRLDIVSFYETQPTSIPLVLKTAHVMVLEKDSAVLGYPGETSKALDADHHGVCKYDSPVDPNYIAVRNVLKTLVSKVIAATASDKPPLPDRSESHDLRALLAITELPGVDYSFFRDQWTQGTNEWILQEALYQEWFNSTDSSHRLLWLNGGAATGKSVLSSFIINNLVEQGVRCQYFFIRFGDQKKRTLSLLLRSIAYQIAQIVPGFLQKVTELVEEAVNLDAADPKTIWDHVYKSILFRMDALEPLVWVIDGLDEADDPKALLRLMVDVSSSTIPIRILFTSRKTSDIIAAFERIPSAISKKSISIEGHFEDLDCYIRHELTMSGAATFKESIVRRIVEGSQNNFLWVRLAVERVNTCHRRADVQRALQQLPVGMEALYDRMASEVAGHTNAMDRNLALTILECVTSSLRVLTIAELAQALGDDVSEILDLQRSIVDLCGGFVVVDNGGNVAMIHQTAREYLLTEEDRELRLDRSSAHRRMFLSSLRCLMTIGLRAKVNRSQNPVFLDYAALSWSSHLTNTPLDDSQTWETLRKFLTSNWVLTWIHILAASRQLRILVHASKHISKYATERQEYAAQNIDGNDFTDQELLASWAVDLVKIVGKFGSNLRRNPESIYKLIPPFCPHNSAIYQLFGKTESKTLSVSGLSGESWDDSLSRLSFGQGAYVSSIVAAGGHIAAITASGTVYLYDSSTFEEAAASPITHGERVYRMELNSIATMLATYGYRTTKVWQVSTGHCKVTVPNPDSKPRPLAMLFTDNNTKLVVGTDNRQVQLLDLSHPSPAWQVLAELEEPELEGHFLNAASHMTLNKDGSLIAVAYRGHPLSAWETDGPTHIGHCWRKREVVARGEVIEAVWHPYSPELIGVYIEGDVFKWSPYEDEVHEIQVRASKLALSKDGNLFATGDIHGTVKVFVTSGLFQIYQLTSQDSVFGLAFSPDLCRFYDVRGYYANAWEPNALIRFAEQVGKDIDTDSETESLAHSSTVSVNSAQRIDSITALAASPKGRLYCCGTELGTVRLYDIQLGRLADLYTSKSYFSIEQICWSDDGRYICFSDLSKRVIVLSVTRSSSSSEPSVEVVAEVSMKISRKAPILQLLIDGKSELVLVHTSTKLSTISIATASVTHSIDMPAAEVKWTVHPNNSSLVVGFGSNVVRLLGWDLTEHNSYGFRPQDHAELSTSSPIPTAAESIVDRVIVTHDKKHILIQMSTAGQSTHRRTFWYFPTSSFTSVPTGTTSSESIRTENIEPQTLTFSTLPQSLSSHIDLALACLPNDRLVFLSKTASLCSMKIPASSASRAAAIPPSSSQLVLRPKSTALPSISSLNSAGRTAGPENSSIKEYFPMPGDLIGRDALALSRVWTVERSLLVPRNGEVAVVRCAALF